MTDHLPECTSIQPWETDLNYFCICDWLRACEERVRESAATLWERTDEQMADARRQGYAAALDAAREAVDRLASDMANWSSAETAAATDATPDLTVDQWMWAQRGVHRALVAIDALEEKP